MSRMKRIQGRDAFLRRAWGDAYRSLSDAIQTAPVEVKDLEQLATAAYLTGRDSDYQGFLERAHHAHQEAGSRDAAVRCAFWLGLDLLLRGETAQASGWFSKAQRLVEGHDCVERGYLLLPIAEQHLGENDGRAAHAAAADAAVIGERFGDADVLACARHLQGRALIQQRQVQAGLTLLDEAMLAVVGGALSPIMTGLIYCSVIETCQRVYAFSRSREWTTALTRWCEAQSQMVAFTDECLVHRSEILQLNGDWQEAMAEASRACERFSAKPGWDPSAAAFYQLAELHRLRGQFTAAEQAYRNAGRSGGDPQPGLALLRFAQGRIDLACAAIRRVVSAANDPLRQAKLLPAHIEIMIGAGNLEEARNACHELEERSRQFGADVLRTMAAQARGAVEFASGDALAALGPLRKAFEGWRQVEAPYEAARVRVLIGEACRKLKDHEAGELEFDAARVVFERVGATPELARLEALRKKTTPMNQYPLTRRELQVLRLIAAGKTNKAIATELFLSERTIDRHVSNILGKLSLRSRVAATAYAYDHNLL